MSVARSTVYRYFPIDCDKDISGDVVELSLDQVTWATAAHTPPSSSVQADYLTRNPVKGGLTRYWVQLLTGPTQTLSPTYGTQTIHGRVTDSPEIPYFAWTLNVPND